jgi:caffeoyl-CoA O-methyltransferase
LFHAISPAMSDRMKELERLDAADRKAGVPQLQRLRQVPREIGKFIGLLAASAPAGNYIEIGTSAGYSTLWLSLAAREKGVRIRTFELLEAKIALARETFRLAQVEDLIELIPGDARQHLAAMSDIAFCFLDAEKDVYADCYELVVPRLVKGGLLVADNAINHQTALKPMLDRALEDPRVDAMIVPIENGELVCRRV